MQSIRTRTFPEPQRVALYRRVGGADNVEALLELQEAWLETLCNAQGWEIVANYADRGSGTTPRPPGLCRAIADGSAGKFDVLLVTDISRLTRNATSAKDLFDWAHDKGVAIVTADGLDSRTLHGQLVHQTFVMLAQEDREERRARSSAGIRAASDGGRNPRNAGHKSPVVSSEQLPGDVSGPKEST